MIIDEADESIHSQYYEILHILIPRFLRIVGDGSQKRLCEAQSKLSDRLGDDKNLLHVVNWFHSADFLSLPGYMSINELDPLSIGLFPFDIASACAVNALGIEYCKQSTKLLDLCCCPGGKTQMIYDLLENQARDSIAQAGSIVHIVGVDISKPRLQVCLSLLDRTARFKMSGRYRPPVDFSESVDNCGRCENELVKKSFLPHLLLFNGDGTTFGLDDPGSLVFDSTVQDIELHHMFKKEQRGFLLKKEKKKALKNDGSAAIDSVSRQLERGPDEEMEEEAGGLRKRKNKSARLREQKRLRQVEKNGLTLLFGTNNTNSPEQDAARTVTEKDAVDGDLEVAAEAAPHVAPMGISLDTLTSISSTPLRGVGGCFDYVLVDAECSHDGSYRHMRYVSEPPPPAAEANCRIMCGPAVGLRTDTGASTEASSSGVMCPLSRCAGGNSSSDSSSSSNSVQLMFDSSSAAALPWSVSKPSAAKFFSGPEGGDRDRAGLVILQRGLLSNGFRLLKASTSCSPGAACPSLVYSTCSLEEAQNEGVVQWLLDTHSEAELCPLDLSDLCGVPPPRGPVGGNSDCKGRSRGAAGEVGGALSGTEAGTGMHPEGTEEDPTALASALSLLALPPSQMLQAVDALGGMAAGQGTLRRYSALLCRHWAQLSSLPTALSPVSLAPPVPMPLSGTVRLSKRNGTSGIFIAKFRKRMRTI